MGPSNCILCGYVDVYVAPAVNIGTIRSNANKAGIELSKRSLAKFVKAGWHVLEKIELEWSWHIECVANHVQWMLEQWMRRRPHTVEDMIINVPPGSMKSLILNVFAPAWMWIPENAPHWTLLTISNSDKVVTRDATKTRDLILSDWYKENFLRLEDGSLAWTIRDDVNAIKNFKNTVGGWRSSQPQSASITGDRFDSIFLDDPNDVKDISEVKLKQVEGTWHAAGNRLNDMRIALRIVIQQRTHENDLTGVIFEKAREKLGTEAKRTEHLCIPMEYSEADCACGIKDCDTTLGVNDPRTVDGEILHPERNTTSVLAAEKIRLGPLGVAGQFQQRPAPLGGGMFKHEYWGEFSELPRDRRGYLLTDTVIMTVDSTFGGVDARTGKAKGSSKVCIQIIAAMGSTRYVLLSYHEKMSYPETRDKIRALYQGYKDKQTGEPLIRKLVIENKGNGPAIIAELTSEIPGIVSVNPDGDKMSRANAMHPAVAAGNVQLLAGAPWVKSFKHELGVFPNGRYDDQVDALSQGMLDLAVNTGYARTLMLCVP